MGYPTNIYEPGADGSGALANDKGTYEGKQYIDRSTISGCKAMGSVDKVECGYRSDYSDRISQ